VKLTCRTGYRKKALEAHTQVGHVLKGFSIRIALTPGSKRKFFQAAQEGVFTEGLWGPQKGG